MNFKSYFGKASEVTQPCRYFDKFWEMASRENGTSRTELDRHLDPRIRQTFYTPLNKADRFQVQRYVIRQTPKLALC